MHAVHAIPAPAKGKQWMLLCSFAAAFMANACQAQNLLPQPKQSIWLAVSNQELDGLRGGFDSGDQFLLAIPQHGVTKPMPFLRNARHADA